MTAEVNGAFGEQDESGYREIDHTADLGLEVWGPDLPALLRQATVGLAGLCYDLAAVEPRSCRAVAVGGASREETLIDWLQEVYLAVELDGWLTSKVVHVDADAKHARGTIAGESLDRSRHTMHTEIKAITYHGLRIRRDDRGLLRTTIIIDV